VSSILFTCPIDGLGLSTEIAVPEGDAAVREAGEQIGKHLHLMVDASFTCLNGHSWNVRDNLMMERTA